jgi:hypothetical protein
MLTRVTRFMGLTDLPIKPYMFFFSFLSFNFLNIVFLFHFLLILDWLGNRIPDFFSIFCRVIMISITSF